MPNYMSKMQSDISMSMRGILVDWMVEVQESFELNHETLVCTLHLRMTVLPLKGLLSFIF